MPANHDTQVKNGKETPEEPPASSEARQVIEQYIKDLRAMIERLRRLIN